MMQVTTNVTKTCDRCLVSYGATSSNFYRSARSHDCLSHVCKRCAKDSARRYGGRTIGELRYPKLVRGSVWMVDGSRITVVHLRWHTLGWKVVSEEKIEFYASRVMLHGTQVIQ